MDQELSRQITLAEDSFRAGNIRLAEELLNQILSESPLNSRANELLAYILGNRNDLEGSTKRLEIATRSKDASPESWYYLGVAFLKRGVLDKAINAYRNSLASSGGFFEGFLGLGLALSISRQYAEAVDNFDKALRLRQDSYHAWTNRGSALNNLKNHEEALANHNTALSLCPSSPDILSNRGVCLNDLHRTDEAIADYEKAIAIDPKHPNAWLNYGRTLHQLKRYEKSLDCLEKCLAINPEDAEAWSNRGVTLNDLKRHEEALASHEKALAIRPDYAEAWSNRGVSLNDLKRREEALASHEKALAIKPGHAEAWSNRGVALNDLKRFEEALASYEKALAIKTDYAEAWSNRGITLNDLNRYEEALASYEKALAIKPDMPWLLGDRLRAKMILCDWDRLEDFSNTVLEEIAKGNKASNPFPILAIASTPGQQKKCAEIYVSDKFPGPTLPAPDFPKSGNGKIRIGYFSADFYKHATSYLMVDLFEKHNRSEFELIAFSFGPPRKDGMRSRLEKTFDQFFEVNDSSDREIVSLARSLKIDIAVDLKGFTLDSRTGIFAMRPAPVSVSYLGYPGTMGAGYIDYLIADPVLIPEENQQYFTEKIAYLPNTYQVNDSRRRIAEGKFTRAELGLPETGFVFCCFNNNYKITPDVFDVWMRLLKKIEGSVLWLLEDNPASGKNLNAEALARGIAAERLVFAKRIDLPDHLSRHRQADLFLDTFCYNAHTTASDSLWAGVPILTRLGNSFQSRVAASLLTAVGLPELIAKTAQEYEALAFELAANPERLSSIRQKLARNRLTHPLFDTALFTRHIEAAYKQMTDRRNRGLLPDHLHVEA